MSTTTPASPLSDELTPIQKLVLRAVAESTLKAARTEGRLFSGKQQYYFQENTAGDGQIIRSLWVRLWGHDSELIDSWDEEAWGRVAHFATSEVSDAAPHD